MSVLVKLVNSNFINKILEFRVLKEWIEKEPSNKEESSGMKLTSWAAKLHISPRTVESKVTGRLTDQSMYEHKQDAMNFFNVESVLPLSIS